MGNSPSHPPPRQQSFDANSQGSWPQSAYPYPYPQQGASTHSQPAPNYPSTPPPPQGPGWPPYYGYSGNPYSAGYSGAYHYSASGYSPMSAAYPYPSGYPGGYWPPGAQEAPPASATAPGPVVEHLKEIQTVRNPVNVKRTSLRLERDRADPSKHVLSFTFDATVSGKMAVFYVAQEGPCCSFRPLHPDLYCPSFTAFHKGLAQKFQQAPSDSASLALFPEEQLLQVEAGEGGEEVFPLVICMVSRKVEEGNGDGSVDHKAEGKGEGEGSRGSGEGCAEDAWEGFEPGQALDPSVQAQMTYAVLKRRAAGAPLSSGSSSSTSTVTGRVAVSSSSVPLAVGRPHSKSPLGSPPAPADALALLFSADYDVRVVKQRIWVDGTEYDLQEIYGMEDCASKAADGNAEDAAPSSGGAPRDPEFQRDTSTSSDSGTECVICLSAPRNTTVLPCRHMCMCGECADVLRFQSNKCPICRHTVEGLLQIKVSSKKGSARELFSQEGGGDSQNGDEDEGKKHPSVMGKGGLPAGTPADAPADASAQGPPAPSQSPGLECPPLSSVPPGEGSVPGAEGPVSASGSGPGTGLTPPLGSAGGAGVPSIRSMGASGTSSSSSGLSADEIPGSRASRNERASSGAQVDRASSASSTSASSTSGQGQSMQPSFLIGS